MGFRVAIQFLSFRARGLHLLTAVAAVALCAPSAMNAGAAEIRPIDPPGPVTDDVAFDSGRSSQAVAREAIRTAQLEWLFGPRRPEPQNGSSNTLFNNDGRSYYAPRYYSGSRHSERTEQRTRRRLSTAALRKAERRERLAREERLKNRVPRVERIEKDLGDIWRGGFTEQRVEARLKASPPPPPTNGPLLVTVSIEKQRLNLYDEGVSIAETPVSTGIKGRETPLGVFSVLQKEQWHRSNLYDDAPMPYMQRLTWDGIALHGGVVPRYPASHGCVRMPEKFAIRLWRTTQRGARVIIAQNDVKPIDITHPLLFKTRPELPPALIPLPAPAPNRNPPADNAPQVDLDHGGAARVASANKEDIASLIQDALEGGESSLLEDIQESIPAIAEIAVMRGGAPAEVISIAPAAGKSRTAAAKVAPETTVKVATREVTIIRGGRATEVRTIEMPSEHIVQVAAKPADISGARAVARNDEMPILIAYTGDPTELMTRLNPRLAQSLGQVIPDTPAEATPAPAPEQAPAPKQASRRGPLSIYISRAQQKIFVRKGFQAVFDMPITITAPRRRMGTFVFTANADNGNQEAFRWTVVAVGDGGEGRDSYDTDRSDLQDAQRALDRIHLPPEATEKLGQMVGVGASIIVSDKPSVKLGEYDDFSVVLREAPQNATLPSELSGTRITPRKKPTKRGAI